MPRSILGERRPRYKNRLASDWKLRTCWRQLSLEPLEERVVPTNLSDIVSTLNDASNLFNQGTAILNTINGFASDLPLTGNSLANDFALPGNFVAPFQQLVNGITGFGNGTVEQLESDLTGAGFTNLQINANNDGNLSPLPGVTLSDNNPNVFLEATWKPQSPGTPPATDLADASDGLDYPPGTNPNGICLPLFGSLSVTGSINVDFNVGVALNPNNANLEFFVDNDPNATTSNSSSLAFAANLSGDLSGNLSIDASLADVNVLASLGSPAQVSGSVSFGAPIYVSTSGQDGTLNLKGSVSGSLPITLKFAANVTLLSSDQPITWPGQATFTTSSDGSWNVSPINLLPNPGEFVTDFLTNQLGPLAKNLLSEGPLTGALNEPLPLINQSITQLSGLSLPNLSALTGIDLGGLTATQDGGVYGSIPISIGSVQTTLQVNLTDQTIKDFLVGSGSDSLLSWTTGEQSIPLADYNVTVPIFSLGVPGIASLDADAVFGTSASLTYDVGFGMDGNGFYLQAGTASHPTLGISFDAYAGIRGEAEIFGIPLAEAGGDVGFSVTPSVSLTAPPWAADQSKVYLNELALFGAKNPLVDLADAISGDIQGAFTGDVYAKINLLFFSLSFGASISIPVFDLHYAPRWPAEPGGGNVFPASLANDGVLTITAPSSGGLTTISLSESDGQIFVAYGSPGFASSSKAFGGVKSIIFDGTQDASSERLMVDPSVNVPILAKAGSGEDYLQGGSADADSIVGGSGNDTLVAGSGSDDTLVINGTGNDMVMAGSGSDAIQLGSATVTVLGSSGNDSIVGGSGNDSVYGSTGNIVFNGGTGTYFFDGGQGSDIVSIPAAAGNDSVYGGAGGNNRIYASNAGHDLIYAYGASNLIQGGTGGYDTMYGGSGGNNTIYGGDGGDNLIYGGGNGDLICAAVYLPNVTYGGNNTIYAGTGNETLYGGDGMDITVGPVPIDGQPQLEDAAGDGRSVGGNVLVASNGVSSNDGSSGGSAFSS